MCVIIDTNMAHKFNAPIHEDMKPVVRWWFDASKIQKVALGGRLKAELHQAGSGIRKLLAEAKMAGRLFLCDNLQIQSAEEDLRSLHEFPPKVDDLHILALAIVSGARVLISHDQSSLLHQLFKDPTVINPRGSIYQSKDHVHLLREARPCRELKARTQKTA